MRGVVVLSVLYLYRPAAFLFLSEHESRSRGSRFWLCLLLYSPGRRLVMSVANLSLSQPQKTKSTSTRLSAADDASRSLVPSARLTSPTPSPAVDQGNTVTYPSATATATVSPTRPPRRRRCSFHRHPPPPRLAALPPHSSLVRPYRHRQSVALLSYYTLTPPPFAVKMGISVDSPDIASVHLVRELPLLARVYTGVWIPLYAVSYWMYAYEYEKYLRSIGTYSSAHSLMKRRRQGRTPPN